MNKKEYFRTERSGGSVRLYMSGVWRVESLDRIERSYRSVESLLRGAEKIVIDLGEVESVDTGAMVFFITLRDDLKKRYTLQTENIPYGFCRMFRLVKRFTAPQTSTTEARFPLILEPFARLGIHAKAVYSDFLLFINFLGHSAAAMFRLLLHPSSFRVKETATNIYKAGVTALPIVALSAFLVGIVIAFQSAVQLQKYGANIFIVDMIGISIPRELAPLITAIIVAGRSGSAYTAQIGVMKITEEIDAMKTMGFEIFRFVVLPRMVAMIVALPLLIFFADIVGIYGGLLVAKLQLDITPAQFLERLHSEVAVKHYLVGLFKAPFFALIIAAVGCFRGFQVSGNTESIGRYTTMSVVNSIFLVIAMDALFSVIFTELGI
ncbi:putative ABC transport system permease protein [Hydrogenimonas sp.]|nr:putative ABC transport system permease protein [Hydrogenimonas sp.]